MKFEELTAFDCVCLIEIAPPRLDRGAVVPHPSVQIHVEMQARTDLIRVEYIGMRVQELQSNVCLVLTLFYSTGMGGHREEVERRMASRSPRAGVAG